MASKITKSVTGIYWEQHGPGEYSVKLVGPDGTTNMVFARFLGLSAEADAKRLYDFMFALARMLNLHLT